MIDVYATRWMDIHFKVDRGCANSEITSLSIIIVIIIFHRWYESFNSGKSSQEILKWSEYAHDYLGFCSLCSLHFVIDVCGEAALT